MRWRVEISQRKGDDRLLRDVLEEVSIRLHEEAGELFLTSDRFDAVETAAQVHQLASQVQSILAEVAEDDPDIAMSFQVGAVLEKLLNEALRRCVFLNARGASFSFGTGHAIATIAPGPSLTEADRRKIEEEKKEQAYLNKRRKAVSRFVPAFLNGRALQVQRLLQKELNAQSMGHIADLIQSDMGDEMRDLVSQNQLTRFYRSINHPDVYGEQARHIISKQQPPPKPMKLDEARVFIREVITRWLEKKASLPPRG